MREVAGAILVLAGSVLIAAGVVADAVTRGEGGYGNTGYVLGTIAGLAGVALLLGGALRRGWDSIPTDDKRPGSGRAEPGAAADRGA